MLELKPITNTSQEMDYTLYWNEDLDLNSLYIIEQDGVFTVTDELGEVKGDYVFDTQDDALEYAYRLINED